jgi:carbamoyltransferase
MLVLGISDLERDTAAALFDSGRLVAAIEEDKLARSSPTVGIPRLAIEHCLRVAGAKVTDVSVAALATRPMGERLRNRGFHRTTPASRSGAPHWRGFDDGVSWKANEVQLLRHQLNPQSRLVNLEHHLCHAASAFYASEFERALVVTLDESGDLWSGLLALGEGTDLNILRPIRFPNSLGWFYTQVTKLLGFRPGRDEHKVQWLSKEGTPDFIGVFRRLFSKDPEGLPVINLDLCTNGLPSGLTFSPQLCRELRISQLSPPGATPLGATIARSAQDFLEETVIDLAEAYRIKTATRHLCVAGGIFLNVLLVRALEKRTGFDKVFAQPVAGNPGTASGAAYLAEKRLHGLAGRSPLRHLYLGPKFTDDQIKCVLDNCMTIYRYFPSDGQLIEETVRLLHAGSIVGWYQGGLEFGHRALGARSILASPFSPYVRENLNIYVKHREDFHPLALSAPAEKASVFFDCTDNCRFMASVATLKDSVEGLDRFTFNDRSIRLHTVDRDVNPRFWGLLHKFGEGTPAPVLVNTSFNLFGEPLVCDPRDAIRTYACAAIDALVIDNYLLVKP